MADDDGRTLSNEMSISTPSYSSTTESDPARFAVKSSDYSSPELLESIDCRID